MGNQALSRLRFYMPDYRQRTDPETLPQYELGPHRWLLRARFDPRKDVSR